MATDKSGNPYRRKIYIWLHRNEFYPHEIKGISYTSTNMKQVWDRLNKFYYCIERELHNQEWEEINSYPSFVRVFKYGSRLNLRMKPKKPTAISQSRYQIEQHTI